MSGTKTHPTTASIVSTGAENCSVDLTPTKPPNWYDGYREGMRDAQAIHETFGPSAMSPKQYKTIIDGLGLSQERAGEWLGVSARTGQNYAAKGPPEPVAKLLRLMARLKLKPEDVK